jgi:glycerol-1-phosphate dehydrogenase [NAD(P)+]
VSAKTTPDGLITRYRAARTATGDGARELGIDEVLLGSGRLAELAAAVIRTAGPHAQVCLLTDATPKLRSGSDLNAMVVNLLSAAGHRVAPVTIGPPDGQVHATGPIRAAAREAIADADCVVSVGSGTITDLAKDAISADGEGIPLVAVQTALSVNGFSDDLAVILVDGVKRTVPSVWPRVLLIDTEVVAAAPAHLNRAGVGELLAMFTAPADWRLADLVGQDGSYSSPLVRLFRDDGEVLFEIASGIRDARATELEQLARIMTASGVALGLAGRTAPMSGMEHTVSHLLDMSGARLGLPIGVHGEQVGVAAVVVACLWERLLDRDDLWARADDEPDLARLEASVTSAFAAIDPSGVMAAECWNDYGRKIERWAASRDERRHLADRWETCRAELRGLLAPPERMVRALRDAGAPTRFRDLHVPVSTERAYWAMANCNLMRDRFTVADLAALTGGWNDGDVTAVLDRAAELGGGL